MARKFAATLGMALLTLTGGSLRADTTTGLLGYWSFDYGSGASMTHGNPITVYGKKGRALRFDGVNDWLSATIEGQPVSVSVYARPQGSVTSRECLLSVFANAITGGNPGSYSYGASAVYAGLDRAQTNAAWLGSASSVSSAWNFNGFYVHTAGPRGTTAGGAAPVDDYRHIVVTHDGGLIRVYVNGVQVSSSEMTIPLGAGPPNLHFSIGANQGTELFRGEIDEVKIYNRPLSQGDVLELKAEFDATNDYQDGPAGWWNFADYTSSTLPNRAGSILPFTAAGSPVVERIAERSGLNLKTPAGGLPAQQLSLASSPATQPVGEASFSFLVYSRGGGVSGPGFNLSPGAITLIHSPHPSHGFTTTNFQLPAFSANNWHHVLLTMRGSSATAYIDGVPHGLSLESYYSMAFHPVPWVFSGDLSVRDVRLWRRIVSAGEAASLFAEVNRGWLAGKVNAPLWRPFGSVLVSAGEGDPLLKVSLPQPGAFKLPVPLSGSYPLSAFWDIDGDGGRDGDEPMATHPNSPILAIGEMEELNLNLPAPVDTDTDGLPDAWERRFGNSTTGMSAVADQDGDGLSNLSEYLSATNPLVQDTDADGVSDNAEVAAGTSGIISDSDGDGMSDGWEFGNGLNPLVNDALLDRDLDGLTNKEEYDRRADGYRANSANSRAGQPGDNGTSDYRHLKGEGWVRRAYDKNDRLIATERDNGTAHVYRYDGNSQKVRDVLLPSLDADGDGLPDAWEFIHDLAYSGVGTASGSNGALGDADGDGFTNFQEWQNGTDPRNGASHPSLFSTIEPLVASGFTPTNWTMAVGQLDGSGPGELIVGADGSVGATAISATLLTRSARSWSSLDIPLGNAAIRSVAIGSPSPGESPGIYIGTRPAAGPGAIVEFRQTPAGWSRTASEAVTSGSDAPQVISVSPADGMLAVLSLAAQPASSVYRLSRNQEKWGAAVPLETTVGGNSLASPAVSSAIRWTQTGALQVVGPISAPSPPAALSPFRRIETGSWYFLSPGSSWSPEEQFAVQNGGHLATINDAAENSWLAARVGSGPYWIGLYNEPDSHPVTGWKWASGLESSYRNWGPGEPNGVTLPGTLLATWFRNTGLWEASIPRDFTAAQGICEVTGIIDRTQNSTGDGAQKLVWKGRSACAGRLRPGSSNQLSGVGGFIDDKNNSQSAEQGDDFVLIEYEVLLAGLVPRTLHRIPMTSVNGAYGLTILHNADSGKPGILAVGEPDGTVSLWTAPDATAPLVRKVFTTEFAGKAWHQMEPLKEADGREGLVGLLVDSAMPQSCQVIHWSPEAIEASLSGTAPVLNHAPLARVLPVPSSGGARSTVAVRVWDAEAHASTVALQFQRAGETAWTDARLVSVDGAVIAGGAAGPTAPLSAQPGGVTHTLVWDAGTDLGAGFTGTVLLRTRGVDRETGAWSEPMPYLINPAADTDTDGDGATDAVEAAFGTNPNSAASRPAVQVVHNANGTLTFTWPAAAGRTYRLEVSADLGGWTTLQSNIPASTLTIPAPPAGTGKRFYRVAAE